MPCACASVQKKLGFSGMFMSATPTITASATATIVPSGKYCVISLENTAVTGITATGNANVNLGCGMITNSTSLTAAVATGSSERGREPDRGRRRHPGEHALGHAELCSSRSRSRRTIPMRT